MSRLLVVISLCSAIAACGKTKPAQTAKPAPQQPTSGQAAATLPSTATTTAKAVDSAKTPKKPAAKQGRIPRARVNRLLAALNEPVFWTADTNGDGIPQATELSVLWSRSTLGTPADWQRYVKHGRPGIDWVRAWNRVRLVHAGGWPWRNMKKEELERRKAV
ncbi:MAG: hypothetical protein KC502_10040, partial [Myxococcales bacterium]|nr:hypothetical protein [Myxococcales bacterium]